MAKNGVIALSAKELDRLRVLHRVKEGALKLKDAAIILNLSRRQISRIWERFRNWGASGLVHRARGIPSNRRKDDALRVDVLRIYEEHYTDFGPTLASEKMKELHGLEVNRETLRRWLIGACLWPGKTRHRKHRKRRRRKEHFGEMVQLDGSDHTWFEDRAKRSCMMVMVDDATGISQGHMCSTETTQDALFILRKWIEKYGVPVSLYTDRKNIYVTNRPPNRKERREGTGALTDFGQVCARLGIQIIPAGSPQAKGRIERKNGVLQDRFVKELRIRSISGIQKTNSILDEFMEGLNRRFGKPPMSEANYHRHLPPKADLDHLLRLERTRCLHKDWTFEYKGVIYQINAKAPFLQPGVKLTLCETLDGKLVVQFRGNEIPFLLIGRKL